MNISDEELQRKIQQGLSENSLDGRTYKKVFDALQKEPYTLSGDFADKIMAKVESRQSLGRDYLWFGVGLLIFLAGAVVAVIFSNLKLNLNTLHLPTEYTGVAVFGVLFIVILQIVDKRFIHRRSGV